MAKRLVKHRLHEWMGLTDGTTRIKRLFENSSDKEETRVRLYDGSVKIASEANLIDFTEAGQSGGDTRNPHPILTNDASAIVRQINDNGIPDECLVDPDAWKAICRVREAELVPVDEEAWAELCRRRGYLLCQKNPRGS
jgi:hypothetical protein